MNGFDRRDEPERDPGAGAEAHSRARHPSRWMPPGASSAPPVAPEPSPAAHVERVAVAWLARHSCYLDPDLADDDTRHVAREALLETAQLVELRVRLDPRPLDDDYQHLLDLIAAVAARSSFRELIARDHRALRLHAGIYAALRGCGLEDGAFRHVLEGTIAGRRAGAFERAPHRQIELLHTLELVGLRLPGPSLADTLALTLLVADPNALELSATDVSAITHAVFYASDFGQRPVPWPAGVRQSAVVELLEECLVLARAHEDADLVGELLVCLTCLQAPATQVATAARRWLRGWQESDGRVEGAVGTVPQGLLMADADWTSWVTAEHTTLVAALDSLLLRTTAANRAAPVIALDAPAPPSPLAAALAPSITAAARWLETAVPGTHLRGRLWATEAWLAVGDEAEARHQMEQLAEDPHVAFSALKESRDLAVHLAALVLCLGVECAPLADLLDDVAALLASTDPRDAQVGCARASRAGARGGVWRPGADLPLPESVGDLRAASIALCSELIALGPIAQPRPRAAEQALLLLARSARAAVGSYDVGWLADVLRGLHRLAGAPPRLVRDATEFLIAQQGHDGGIGTPELADATARQDLIVQWTLLALPALVEAAAAPPMAAAA